MSDRGRITVEAYTEKATELFALPETALRLQELLNDDRSSLSDVADVVSIDPNLTTMLLKVANSAFYNFPSSIDTVSRAINVIGSEAVFNLALASSAVDCFQNTPKNVIDLELFWRHSVDTALICKELGQQIRSKNKERLFVIGLLHNLGELVCATETPDLAQACAQDNPTIPPWTRQKNTLGFTYAELSMALLKAWKLPPEIYNTVGNQHTPEQSSFPVEAGLLYLSTRLALSLSVEQHFEEEDRLTLELANRLGLSTEHIQEAIEYANLEAINILSILNPLAGAIF